MGRNFHVRSLGRAGVSSTLNMLKQQGLSSNTHIWIYKFEEDAYKKEYPDMNIHTVDFEKNLSRKVNCILDFIQEQAQPAVMLDDDINYFAIGKNPFAELIKTTDFALVYDLFERAVKVCPEISNLCCKRNFITTFNAEPNNLFTKFSCPSAVIFYSGKPMISRPDINTTCDDLSFATECWINKELALKFNIIYVNHTYGTNDGGLQTDKTNYNESTKLRKETEHKFMVNKYDNEVTYTTNEDTGYFGSNGTKVRRWLIDSGRYTETEMKELDTLVKELSKRVFNDSEFNNLLVSANNTKYLYIK